MATPLFRAASFRSKASRLHLAQLGILVSLAVILVHQVRTLIWCLPEFASWKHLTWGQIYFSGLDYFFFSGVLIVSGVILVYKVDALSAQKSDEPLQDILQCVEAAAAGDLSRAPTLSTQDNAGPLSRAVGRLITVLERSENLVYHLAALVESSGDAIISYTLDGTILSWNKGAQRIYGYSAEEIKGRSITLLYPNEDGAEMKDHLERIRNGERIQPFETIHRARNGRTVKALVRISAILDSTRKVIGTSFCAQDLTDIAPSSSNATHQGTPEHLSSQEH